MKEFLSRAGRPYIDKNVEEDPSAYSELRALGWRSIPVTLVNGRAVKGFDQVALRAALDAPPPPADR
ncbi:MAG: glutaredoxin family protein [Acidobacteria bacterium]|nr:glutaredoxin family protein [Acidobacteriota bacterium]